MNKTFKERSEASKKLRQRHPRHALFHVMPSPQTRNVPFVSKRIFVVKNDVPISSVMCAVRSYITNLKPEQALYFMIDINKNNWECPSKQQQLIPLDQIDLVSAVETQHAKMDGFVYVYYDFMEAFG